MKHLTPLAREGERLRRKEVNEMETKHYQIILSVDATPEVMRNFREALDELCENGPEYAEFTVYCEIPYGEE